MVYLSGDNNLSSAMIDAINAIGTVAMAPEIAITIQFDPSSTRFPTARYDLTGHQPNPQNRSEGLLGLKTLRVPGTFPEDSANPDTLADFIAWSIAKHPSKYRMLILSGHGSGAVGDFLPDRESRRGESGSMTVRDLPKAFSCVPKRVIEFVRDLRCLDSDGIERDDKERSEQKRREQGSGRFIDILGMDSCLMSMAEVSYQVRDFVHYLVASEGFVPNFGWPYSHMFGCLMEHLRTARDRGPANSETSGKNPDLLEPAQLTEHVVKDYLDYYTSHVEADVSVDIASCDVESDHELRRSLCTLTSALTLRLNSGDTALRDLLVLAHWRAQSFNYEQYTDLWDFCIQLRDACPDGRYADIKTNCNIVAETIEALVGGGDITGGKRRQGYVGGDFQHAHGMSIYFPWSNPGSLAFANYSELLKDEDGWAAFLRSYLNSTRRDTRTPSDAKWRDDRDQVTGPTPTAVEEPSAYRNSPGYNKNSPGYNRLLQAIGVPLPGNMKNPATKPSVPDRQ
jgi:hypothetical protein